jgi:hypothetical protein
MARSCALKYGPRNLELLVNAKCVMGEDSLWFLYYFYVEGCVFEDCSNEFHFVGNPRSSFLLHGPWRSPSCSSVKSCC